MNRIELQPAIDFVQANGSAVELARLRFVLDGQAPPADVLEQLSRSQRGDGGWAPFWAPDYSSVDATCYQLAQADQLGLDRRAMLFIDGVRFLAERQQPNGFWEEDPAVAASAPVWASPGDQAARLYLTANCGFWVAMSGFVPSAARDAAVYLADHQNAEGELPSFLQTQWLAAALWQRLEMTTEVNKALGYMHGRLFDLSAGNLAWMVIALHRGGVAPAHATIAGALDRLAVLRDTAGNWPSDEGATNAVHVTIEALLAFQLAGRLL